MKSILVLIRAFFLCCPAICTAQEVMTEGVTDDSTDNAEMIGEQTVVSEDAPLPEVGILRDARQPGITWSLRSRGSSRLVLPRGYEDGTYLGSPVASYQRISLRIGSEWRWALLAEKDPGERRFDDDLSWYFTYEPATVLQRIVVGTFYLEGGQGLVAWRRNGMIKGAETVRPARRVARGIVPVVSSDDRMTLRGIAASVLLGPMDCSVFLSRRGMDGSSSPDADAPITSLWETGYHRTRQEELRRNAVTETVYGMRTNLRLREMGSFGCTAMTSRYSRSIADLGGPSLTNIALDGAAGCDDVQIMVEAARSFPGTRSVTGSVLVRLFEHTDVVVSYRDLSEGFHSIRGNPFGEWNGRRNEQGLYVGCHLSPVRGMSIALYRDVYKGASSSMDFGEQGVDDFLMLRCSLLHPVDLRVQVARDIRTLRTVGADQDGRNIRRTDQRTKYRGRLQVDAAVSSNVRMRSRCDYVSVWADVVRMRENGLVVYQEFVASMSRLLKLSVRVTAFQTDSYESGVAEYERDVPGAMSLPILYGDGLRWLVLMKLTLTPMVTLSARFARTQRDDVRSIGSGPDTISGNQDDRLTLQLDLGY